MIVDDLVEVNELVERACGVAEVHVGAFGLDVDDFVSGLVELGEFGFVLDEVDAVAPVVAETVFCVFGGVAVNLQAGHGGDAEGEEAVVGVGGGEDVEILVRTPVTVMDVESDRGLAVGGGRQPSGRRQIRGSHGSFSPSMEVMVSPRADAGLPCGGAVDDLADLGGRKVHADAGGEDDREADGGEDEVHDDARGDNAHALPDRAAAEGAGIGGLLVGVHVVLAEHADVAAEGRPGEAVVTIANIAGVLGFVRGGGEIGLDAGDGVLLGVGGGSFGALVGFGIPGVGAEGEAAVFAPAAHARADADGECEALDAAHACDGEVAEFVEEDDEREAKDDVEEAEEAVDCAHERPGRGGEGDASTKRACAASGELGFAGDWRSMACGDPCCSTVGVHAFLAYLLLQPRHARHAKA